MASMSSSMERTGMVSTLLEGKCRLSNIRIRFLHQMIRNKLNQEPNALDEVVSRVKLLSNQLEDMQKLFKYVKAIEGVSNSRMAWLKVMKTIACAAVDFIKNLEFSASERRNYLNDTKRLHHIKHAISLLKRSTEVYRIELRQVVGLEEDTHSVVSRLTNSEHFSIISIVGMQGIGKTILAKNVYNHRAIVKHFSLRAWVSIGQEFDENVIFEELQNRAKSACRPLISSKKSTKTCP